MPGRKISWRVVPKILDEFGVVLKGLMRKIFNHISSDSGLAWCFVVCHAQDCNLSFLTTIKCGVQAPPPMTKHDYVISIRTSTQPPCVTFTAGSSHDQPIQTATSVGSTNWYSLGQKNVAWYFVYEFILHNFDVLSQHKRYVECYRHSSTVAM